MVEIKIMDDIALDQLSTYISQIFMECIDQLFVIVFTLSEHSFACIYLIIVGSCPLSHSIFTR